MLNLDQCVAANRPLIFTVAESDMEVLHHLRKSFKDQVFFVYSSTLVSAVRLDDLLDRKFRLTSPTAAKETGEVLSDIYSREFPKTNSRFETYIFLDCQSYINDQQVIRYIKDINSRYQMDENYTVNLIFISQIVGVPMQLERLSEVVFFDLPSEEQLKAVSDDVAVKLGLKKLEQIKSSDVKRNKGGSKEDLVSWPSNEVVNNLKGLTLYEVEQAYLQSFNLHKRIELGFIRDFKKNALAKTDLLSLLESDVTFDDIGGLIHLKKWIDKSYGGWTLRGKEFGLPLLKGLLLVGLPGCGKSLVAKALGNQWKLPVIQFDPSRVFSSGVGDSEGNMRRVLQIIENISPCILFIDEVEKGLAGMQSSSFSDGGVTARVIGSFLIWMQDCKKPVFTVATANALQFLPPEMISRFDETFFVNIPQKDERKEIFNIHLNKLNKGRPSDLSDDDRPIVLKDIDCGKLAEISKDLSGREIEQSLRESMYDAFHQGKKLTTDIIMGVLKKKTSLLTTMAEQLDYLLKWVGYDEDNQDGIRARFASPVDSGEKNRIQSEIDEMLKDVEKGNS